MDREKRRLLIHTILLGLVVLITSALFVRSAMTGEDESATIKWLMITALWIACFGIRLSTYLKARK